MGLIDILGKILSPGDPFKLDRYTLPGRGKLPTGWSRDYVHIKVSRPAGSEIFNATRDSAGHIYVRPGYAHRSSVRNATREGRDHVHRTPDGRLRDDSNGTATRLGIAHKARMGFPRTRLSDKALQRELRAQVDQVHRTNGVIDSTLRSHGFGKSVTSTFGRQMTDLVSLKLNAQRLHSVTREMRAEAFKSPRGLTSAAKTAQGAWRTSISTAEGLAKHAASANETAIKAAAKAAEASTKAASAVAEAEAKAAAAAAEQTSKAAAKAAEEAAKASMRAAEGVAKTAGKATEAAIKAAAAAAEATVKATAAVTEAAVKAAAYTAAAAASVVASAFDS